MRGAGAIVVVSTLIAASAGAQALRPLSVDQGQARAQATALIKAAQATDLFVAGATPQGPMAQHVKSNLVCHFEPGAAANQIKVFDSGPNRGDDVGCGTQFQDVTATVFAVRAKGAQDVVRSETQTLADIKRQFPDSVDYKGPVAKIADKGRPSMAVARLTSAKGRKFMRATTFRLGDWVFSQTIVASDASALKADQYAEAQLTKLIAEVRLGRPQ